MDEQEIVKELMCIVIKNPEGDKCMKALANWIIEDRKRILHKMRMLIQSLPIKNTEYRWRIVDKNQNIGWNECRLEMFKKIGTLAGASHGE